MDNRLFVLYKKHGSLLYGVIHVVRDGLDDQQSSFPFIVSSHIQDNEIIYGNLITLMQKIARLLFRLEKWIRDVEESMPEEIKSAKIEAQGPAKNTFALPETEYTSLLFQLQEEKSEETILLTLLHLRTLLEVFGGKGNASVDLYDYEDNKIGEISLMKLANLLMHHRYFVVDGNYVHDVFSDKRQLFSDIKELPSQRLFGSKFILTDLFNAMLTFLTGIRINDFVGVLRSRLERLTVNSEPKDIIFLIQNIHSLSNIMQERFTDSRFHEVFELLFRDVRKRHIIRGSDGVERWKFSFAFGKPEFKIDDELSERRIAMTIMIDGKSETFKFGYEEFFGILTKVYGEDPLFSIEQLRKEANEVPNGIAGA